MNGLSLISPSIGDTVKSWATNCLTFDHRDRSDQWEALFLEPFSWMIAEREFLWRWRPDMEAETLYQSGLWGYSSVGEHLVRNGFPAFL
jgi:hypothetical protein